MFLIFAVCIPHSLLTRLVFMLQSLIMVIHTMLQQPKRVVCVYGLSVSPFTVHSCFELFVQCAAKTCNRRQKSHHPFCVLCCTPPTDCNFFLIFSLQIFLLWKKHIICSDIKGERWENFGLLQLYVFCSPINKNEAHNEKQKKIIAAKRNPTQEQEDSQKCIIKLQQQWKRNEAKYRLSDERVVNLRWVLIADIHR